MTRIFSTLILLLFIATAQAAENIPAPVRSEIAHARLAGQGSFRWFGFRVYDAELWVGDQGYRAAAPESAKFALSITYARGIDGKHIARSSINEIKKLGFGTSEQQETWLQQMNALFPDVHQGTQISGIYLPDHGARFHLDGKLLGEVADTQFARAFFAIWLDPRTTAATLRSQLLTSAQ